MTGSTKASALLLGRRLAILVALAASFVAVLFRMPLGPGQMRFYAGTFLLANLVSVGLLARRAARRREDRAGWLILAGSVVALIVSNLAMAGFNPALPNAPLPRILVYVVSQFVAGILMAWGLLALPWEPAKGWVASRSRLMNLLGSLFFMLSLLLLLGLNRGWITGLTNLSRHNAGLLVSGLRIAMVGGVLGFLISQRPSRVFGPLGWLILNVAGLSLSRILVAIAASLVDPVKVTPFLGVGILIPVSMWFAALHQGPAEPEEPRGVSSFLAQGVLLVPFFGASAFMVSSQWRAFTGPPVPVVLFLVLVCILMAMILLALLEVYRVNSGLESLVRDRTRALEEAQAVLLRTERMNALALLGSGAVHDINNLHQVILSNVQLLESSRAEGVEAPPHAHRNLTSAAQRASALTAGLMSFSRPRAEPRQSLDLVPFILDAGGLLDVVLPRSVTLEIRVDAASLPVLVPQDQMEQILVNLVINARDAVAAGGRILITLSRSVTPGGPMACMAVTDDGCGMGPELQARIFEPLFTTKAEGVGTGLGLPSIKAYSESAGGAIEVESAPGRGSTFRVLLPLEA